MSSYQYYLILNQNIIDLLTKGRLESFGFYDYTTLVMDKQVIVPENEIWLLWNLEGYFLKGSSDTCDLARIALIRQNWAACLLFEVTAVTEGNTIYFAYPHNVGNKSFLSAYPLILFPGDKIQFYVSLAATGTLWLKANIVIQRVNVGAGVLQKSITQE